MGRFSETIAFMNMPVLPSKSERDQMFTHIEITRELIEERRTYQKSIKIESKASEEYGQTTLEI